jgi:alpha-beta hydrolase superfamily lysophospholipase/acyl carrier protein
MSAADVPPPIGRPIANTECYVLDPQLGLVPPPAVGELYIGGLGLAREYLHAPELTEERFVKNPYAPGQRMYRTGDVARWRNDGILECFGRTDHQVKLRGFRIELGEIEARLTEHAAVREACVVLRDERLVAYYSTRAPTATNDLRAVLRASLPEYMVPTVFVELAELPRTPNNKIDRKALPAPVLEVAVEPTVAAPRNQIEQALGRVWAKLLGRQQIGVHDDFFDLGGDSLLAVKSVALIREALSVEVSPIEIMRNATIAELARAIAALSAPARAQRTPFYFGRRRLFGFYHPAAAGADAAVLVCSSVGHEHTRAYRTVRELCEVSALAGLPALRFEYSGVGDSAGELATADVDAWTMDILDAADELRRRSGARCLHVVGLRLGAALAVRALKQAQGDFGVLCLWDPLLSGREFLTLASAFQRQYLRDPSRFPPAIMQRHAQRPPADLVLGYGYGDALQRSLASLDVGRTDEWPALSVRAMLSQAAPGWRELAAQLTAQGWHISEEELGSGRTQWNDYDEHERSLRAGPLIARIVERLKEGP